MTRSLPSARPATAHNGRRSSTILRRKSETMSYAFFRALFPKALGPDQDKEPDQDPGHLGYVVVAQYPTGIFTEGVAPSKLTWFAWPAQEDQLVAFCLSQTENDLYTVPALFKSRTHRRADNIAHQWCVYADADSLPLDKLRLEPTLTVETSPGRHHTYWVTPTDDPALLCDIGRAIAHTHAADGCDKGGWDAGQLLRIPGSTNNKYFWQGKGPQEVRIVREGEATTVETLRALYPPVVPTITPVDEDMPPVDQWINDEIRQKAAEVYMMVPDIEQLATDDITAKTDRSAKMWRLLGELARCAVDRKVAMYIAWHAKCNKYRLDRRSHEEMWNELCRAYGDPQNQPVSSEFAAIDRAALMALDTNPIKQAETVVRATPLLTDEERATMRTDLFPDRYTRWAATRTDAPHQYHRAGATTILSSLFGPYGMCPTTHRVNLTLWFLLLGPTTRARKSTAMNLWVDLIRELEDGQHSYLLGSSITAEALYRVLPRRNGKTSIFYRDEVHGMFDEQDKKRYLAGLDELVTDLYNGIVPVSLRASMFKDDDDGDTSDNIPKGKVTTNFILFFCGTIQQVTDKLTIGDYQSGYLTRFLAAFADPPPLTEEGIRAKQRRGNTLTDDLLRQELVVDLAHARDFWHEKTNGGTVKPEIPFEDPAWDRLQDAVVAMYKSAEQNGADLAEILIPTALRMGTSIMKAAVLLAMSECKTEVEMSHVLKAIELAEEWYAATVLIAGKIMHSVWAQRQEEIRVKIQSRKDGITEEELFRAFRSRFNIRDFEQDLAALLKADLIMFIPENGRKRYIVTKRY